MLKKCQSTGHAGEDGSRFCQPEILLLDGFRLWSQNPENLTYIRRRMTAEMGTAQAERASKALKMLAYLIGMHTRRMFLMHHPGVMKATPDERTLIALIGAALHGRRAHANAIVTWMMPTRCHGTVLAVAGELGRAFRAGGLELAPPRDAVLPERRVLKVRSVA